MKCVRSPVRKVIVIEKIIKIETKILTLRKLNTNKVHIIGSPSFAI